MHTVVLSFFLSFFAGLVFVVAVVVVFGGRGGGGISDKLLLTHKGVN